RFQSPAVEDAAPRPDCAVRHVGDVPLRWRSEIRTLGPRYEKKLLEAARSTTPATEVPRLRREGPRVRIRLPPAASHQRNGAERSSKVRAMYSTAYRHLPRLQPY